MPARRLKIARICLLCGTNFHPWDEFSKYCSQKCSIAITALHPSEPFLVKFWRQVNKTDTCWLWTGCGDGKSDGYGRIVAIDGKSMGAHRASWEIHNGPIPPGLDVLHSCDIRRCINPAHLSLGGDVENQRQAWARGRKTPKLGTRNGMNKLHPADVLTIRAWPSVRQSAMAKHYGISQVTVSAIRRGRLWAHLSNVSNGPLPNPVV